VESGDFGFNLMKYWQISPVFTHEVGLLIKFHVLTDSATWNPGRSLTRRSLARKPGSCKT